MQKKRYLFVAIFILFLFGLIPWLDGIQFKRDFLELINIVSQDNRIKIDLLEYKRGWLHSHAKLRVTFVNTGLTNLPQINLTAPISFIVEENISHGPIVYDHFQKELVFGYASIQSILQLSDQASTSLPENIKSETIMQIQTISKMNGHWVGQVHIPALSFSMPIGKINLLGFDWDYRITVRDDRIKHLIVDLKTGTLSLKVDPKYRYISQINIQPIKYHSDSLHDVQGLWSGNSTLFTPGISIERPDGKSFSTDKIVINNKFGVSGVTFYETNLSINISNLKTPSQIIASIPTLQIWLSANSFSAQGIYDYMTFFNDKTPEAIKNVDLKTIEKLMANTVTSASILNTDISIATILGDATLKSKTTLQPNASMPTNVSDILDNSFTTATVTSSSPLAIKIIKMYDELFLNTASVGEINNASEENKTEENSDNVFDNQIVQYLKQDKIKLLKAIEIVELEKNKFSFNVFSTKLDELNVPPEIAFHLKKIYQSKVKDEKKANKASKQDIRQMIISDKAARQLIDDLEQVGGVTKDSNNNYNTTITISNGVVKFNGWTVN